MYSADLFHALMDPGHARNHPLLLAWVYQFCPAAARWWISGAIPQSVYDPAWHAFTDVAARKLFDCLSEYGFDALQPQLVAYIEQVWVYRRNHPGMLAPELMPGFPGGRIDSSHKFGLRRALAVFDNSWDNLFLYVRAAAILREDWERELGFPKPPKMELARLAVVMPGYRKPIFLTALTWQFKERAVLGLFTRQKHPDELRFRLAALAAPLGSKPWDHAPEVRALNVLDGTAELFTPRIPAEAWPILASDLADAAEHGPYLPATAMREADHCELCGFKRLCFDDSGRSLNPQVLGGARG